MSWYPENCDDGRLIAAVDNLGELSGIVWIYLPLILNYITIFAGSRLKRADYHSGEAH